MWIGDVMFDKVSVPFLDSIYTKLDTEIVLALHSDTRITIEHE